MKKRGTWLVVLALSVGTLVGTGAPAKAFDGGRCDSFYGAGNVAIANTFSVDTGTADRVDFGDHPHWFAKPQGTAVACFARDGRVALFGYVFADSEAIINAQARISFLRPNGTASERFFGGWGNYGAAFNASRSSGADTSFNRIRVELFNGTAEVFQRTFSR